MMSISKSTSPVCRIAAKNWERLVYCASENEARLVAEKFERTTGFAARSEFRFVFAQCGREAQWKLLAVKILNDRRRRRNLWNLLSLF